MIAAMLAMTLVADISQILDKESKVEQVATGFRFTEGPAWTRDGRLIFSDIPADSLHVLEKGKTAIYRQPSGNANGNTIGPDGLLYTACHGLRAVIKEQGEKMQSTYVQHFEGKQLNSPNDLVFRRNGDLYFTDPAYGLRGKPSAVGFNGVYLLKKGQVSVVLAKDFQAPNGIVFSPDEKVCYVADTAKKHIRAFDMAANGTFGGGRLFAENIAGPDGMRVDSKGNLYVAASGGVHVFGPMGHAIGIIPVPENPTNLAWGDRDSKTLYITAQKSLYRVRCKIKGIRF